MLGCQMDSNGSGWGPVVGCSEILGSCRFFLSAMQITDSKWGRCFTQSEYFMVIQ